MWPWILLWLLIIVLGSGWLFLLAREVVLNLWRLFADISAASEQASVAGSGDVQRVGEAYDGVPPPWER